MELKTAVVSELAFHELHDRLKKEGRRILRCIERVAKKGRTYELVWI